MRSRTAPITRTAALAAVAFLAPPASANDATVEVGVGGLQMVYNSAIAVVSEDLFVSTDEIRVAYRYRNITNAPVTVTVAFPLPPLDGREYQNVSVELANPNSENFVNFELTINGKPSKRNPTSEYRRRSRTPAVVCVVYFVWLHSKRNEHQRVGIVHRNDQLIGNRVVAHGSATWHANRDEFRGAIRRDARDAAEANAAHVLSAIGHDYDTIVTAVDGVSGFDQLASRSEGVDVVGEDVNDDDIAVAIDGNAVRKLKDLAFPVVLAGVIDQYRPGAVRIDLEEAVSSGIRRIDGAVLGHGNVVEASRLRDGDETHHLTGCHIPHGDHSNARIIIAGAASAISEIKDSVDDVAAERIVDECAGVFIGREPLKGVHGAVMIDQRHPAIIVEPIPHPIAHIGHHDEIARSVVTAALGEIEPADNPQILSKGTVIAVSIVTTDPFLGDNHAARYQKGRSSPHQNKPFHWIPPK